MIIGELSDLSFLPPQFGNQLLTVLDTSNLDREHLSWLQESDEGLDGGGPPRSTAVGRADLKDISKSSRGPSRDLTAGGSENVIYYILSGLVQRLHIATGRVESTSWSPGMLCEGSTGLRESTTICLPRRGRKFVQRSLGGDGRLAESIDLAQLAHKTSTGCAECGIDRSVLQTVLGTSQLRNREASSDPSKCPNEARRA